MLSLKKQINRYWTQRAPDFSALRKAELASPKGQLWRDELLQFLPNAKHAQTPIRVLDIGTGSGFFAFLLEPLGYSVTGIDLSDAMIEQARVWARSLNSRVAFHCMDAENPRFADQTFDVLITRNLTWTLPDLPAAYRNWKRLLRPNGVLVNFDADYSHSPRTRKTRYGSDAEAPSHSDSVGASAAAAPSVGSNASTSGWIPRH